MDEAESANKKRSNSKTETTTTTTASGSGKFKNAEPAKASATSKNDQATPKRKNSKPAPVTPEKVLLTADSSMKSQDQFVQLPAASVEEDLKQHLFTWLTLALKFDRMSMRRLCSIFTTRKSLGLHAFSHM